MHDSSELEDALMCLRATIVLRNTEAKLRSCSDNDVRTGLAIKAYYLGQEYPNAKINPFEKMEHQFKKDLVDGFLSGSLGQMSAMQ